MGLFINFGSRISNLIIYCSQISETLKKVVGPEAAETGAFSPKTEFLSLQYALFLTTFVEVIGGLFFFLTALYIQRDKAIVDLSIAGE